MIVCDNLEPAHFLEWGVEDFPHPSRMMGFAVRRDEELVAIACIWVTEDERWVGSFDKRGRFPAKFIHEKTKELLAAVGRAGVPEIWAGLDQTIPRAREWLLRLGFRPADPAETEWTLVFHF